MVSALFGRTDTIALMLPVLKASIRAISIVTLAEVRAGAIKAKWGANRIADLDAVLSSYLQVGIDLAVAETWGSLRAKCLERGLRKSDNDLWIAATALCFGYPVASLDNDFEDIPGITLIDRTGRRHTNSG